MTAGSAARRRPWSSGARSAARRRTGGVGIGRRGGPGPGGVAHRGRPARGRPPRRPATAGSGSAVAARARREVRRARGDPRARAPRSGRRGRRRSASTGGEPTVSDRGSRPTRPWPAPRPAPSAACTDAAPASTRVGAFAVALLLVTGAVFAGILVFDGPEHRTPTARAENPVMPVTAPPPPIVVPSPPVTDAPALPVPEAAPADPYENVPIVAIGEMEIPKIGLVHTIYEGVSLTVVNHGPGHWPGTPMPGGYGNMVFAGHRTTYDHPFRNIDQLVEGDHDHLPHRPGHVHVPRHEDRGRALGRRVDRRPASRPHGDVVRVSPAGERRVPLRGVRRARHDVTVVSGAVVDRRRYFPFSIIVNSELTPNAMTAAMHESAQRDEDHPPHERGDLAERLQDDAGLAGPCVGRVPAHGTLDFLPSAPLPTPVSLRPSR